MRKLKYLILFLVLSFTLNVYALNRNSSDLKNRNVCAHFELAKAKSDGSIESVLCFNEYKLAKEKMNSEEDESLIILERSNNVTKIIDAKYALAYLDRGDKLTYLYSNTNFNSSLTYMDNYSGYGATEAALIEISYGKGAKVRIGGVTGWVKNGEYTVIPVNYVKSSSFYRINDNGITHFYAKDIENNNYSQSSRLLGPKPSFEIVNGDYKSYDGIYFYSDFISMINDYRTGKHDLSVNKDNPYYNYNLYLPHRTKTNYSIDDLDSYIRNVMNFKGSLYGKILTNNNSVIYGTAEYFMYAEKLYGANAISVFSLSRNESANGRSSIAYNKNNVFGHNAVDGAAYSSATGYLDVRSSIYSHGYGYINYGYARVADSRYHGSHFGNKFRGLNVMYASDVYWGEKAASYYYSFDKDNGLLDYNYYQLIISKTGDINARILPNRSSKAVYSIKQSGLPFVLLAEVEGEEVNGNKIWYKILSDSNINSDGSLIPGNSSTWPEYNWDAVLYVHSSYFEKINEGKKEDNNYHTPQDIDKDVNTYKITTNATKTEYNPEVGLVNADKDYYYSSTLLSKAGTIKKNSYVVILEKVVDSDKTYYHIITNYLTNQKAWISSDNVKIVKKDLLKISISEAGGTIDIYDKIGGSVIAKSYTGNFIPIVDKVIKGKDTYLKVLYQITNEIKYGYVLSSISNISYTLNYINIVPVIKANDLKILINEEYDPLNGVTATDTEDGNITKNIKVVSNKLNDICEYKAMKIPILPETVNNEFVSQYLGSINTIPVGVEKETLSIANINVNTKIAGDYEVKYQVTDSYGATVTKVIKVKVYKPQNSDALFMFNELNHIENNKFTFSGFMGVKGTDNKNVTHKLIFVNELTKKEYTFNLTNWKDYPYEMASLDDDKPHDYSGGWFKDTLDLNSDVLPNGDYKIYVYVLNGEMEAKTYFTNIAYMDMTRRAKGLDREFMIDVDYSTLNSPLLFSVRDNLISLDLPKTYDPMYNFINDIKLVDGKLSLKGTSHSVGVNFGIKDTVNRQIVLENQKDFTRYELDLGSITNGDYPITLAVSDNCDKTKAWFNNVIDLSSVKSGSYTIYIKNTVSGLTYYGELIDVMYTDFSSISNEHYILKRNDNLRLRVELIKK